MTWTPSQYPTDQLEEELAFVAYHFHWSREEVMALEHRERRGWADHISAINRQMNDDGTPAAVRRMS